MPVMRCKLICHSVFPKPETGDQNMHAVYFGAVWEGSTEKQQVSENAIFGKMTPAASFTANICNPEVIAKLKQGAHYYVDFTPIEVESVTAE